MQNKAEGLINIAIKAGKTIFGQDAILVYTKKMYGIIVCESASENTISKLGNFCKTRGLELNITKGVRLEHLTHKENNKVIAITAKNLYTEISRLMTSTGELMKIRL